MAPLPTLFLFLFLRAVHPHGTRQGRGQTQRCLSDHFGFSACVHSSRDVSPSLIFHVLFFIFSLIFFPIFCFFPFSGSFFWFFFIHTRPYTINRFDHFLLAISSHHSIISLWQWVYPPQAFSFDLWYWICWRRWSKGTSEGMAGYVEGFDGCLWQFIGQRFQKVYFIRLSL